MTTPYHKIQTVYLRDPATNFKTLLEGQFALPAFEYLANSEWVFTEKVDGTNIRIIFDGEDIFFRGRTDAAEIPKLLTQNLIDLFCPQLPLFRANFPTGVVFYGEGYGAKIQKGGGNYTSGQHFVLFDVNVGKWWLERNNVEQIAQQFSTDVVPIIGKGTLYEMVEKTRQGFNSTWGNFLAEGIVARPSVELRDRGGERIITKIKCRDFAK